MILETCHDTIHFIFYNIEYAGTFEIRSDTLANLKVKPLSEPMLDMLVPWRICQVDCVCNPSPAQSYLTSSFLSLFIN